MRSLGLTVLLCFGVHFEPADIFIAILIGGICWLEPLPHPISTSTYMVVLHLKAVAASAKPMLLLFINSGVVTWGRWQGCRLDATERLASVSDRTPPKKGPLSKRLGDGVPWTNTWASVPLVLEGPSGITLNAGQV